MLASGPHILGVGDPGHSVVYACLLGEDHGNDRISQHCGVVHSSASIPYGCKFNSQLFRF